MMAMSRCHVVAMPYPGRGHVNPMMNLCRQLSAAKPEMLISFVVTQEWLGFISSETKPHNVTFITIPNVIPSEIGRAKDFTGFLQAVSTKMAAPFELLLDGLHPPVTAIVADTYLVWMPELANRRNIPLASLWTMSASVLSVFHHFHLLRKHNHFPLHLSERGEEMVDYIPGVCSSRVADLPTFYYGNGLQCLGPALDCISRVPMAQYLLFTCFYDLEAHTVDSLAKHLHLPLYPIGPCIPYLNDHDHDHEDAHLMKWLHSQPPASVLYVSLGSFLSVSTTQMDEITAGVSQSGVRHLAVSRGAHTWTKGDLGAGMAVPWCDQLRVLCHPSVGGFLSHCGWNSTLEAVYAGVPLLTFPIFWDQVPNSKAIVEDWKIGWRARKDVAAETLVPRDEIAGLVRAFMDPANQEMKQMRERSNKLKDLSRQALLEGGSSQANIQAFLNAIST